MKKRIFSGLLLALFAVGCASTKNNQPDWRNNQPVDNHVSNPQQNGNDDQNRFNPTNYYQPGDRNYVQNGYNGYPNRQNEKTNDYFQPGDRNYVQNGNNNRPEYINPSVDKGNRYPANDEINKARIEQWKNEGLVYSVRDKKGKFVRHGEFRIESWNERNHTSRWVPRQGNGKFVGDVGTLEKFKPFKGEKEQYRLVIRNKKGEFVTWEPMDELISTRWEEVEGERADRYSVRYNGKWINWAEGKVEDWNGYGKVLVVRDTNDGQNNGKILTWIVGEKIGSATQYRNPETGRFLRKAVQD